MAGGSRDEDKLPLLLCAAFAAEFPLRRHWGNGKGAAAPAPAQVGGEGHRAHPTQLSQQQSHKQGLGCLLPPRRGTELSLILRLQQLSEVNIEEQS